MQSYRAMIINVYITYKLIRILIFGRCCSPLPCPHRQYPATITTKITVHSSTKWYCNDHVQVPTKPCLKMLSLQQQTNNIVFCDKSTRTKLTVTTQNIHKTFKYIYLQSAQHFITAIFHENEVN